MKVPLNYQLLIGCSIINQAIWGFPTYVCIHLKSPWHRQHLLLTVDAHQHGREEAFDVWHKVHLHGLAPTSIFEQSLNAISVPQIS